MTTAMMILTIVLSNAAGDLFITRGMKQIGEISTLNPRELFLISKKVIINRNFILGIVFLSISFFSFLAVLSWADLSFVIPATSLIYVVSPLGAKMFLNEEISSLRLAGIVLVCLGVALVCPQ